VTDEIDVLDPSKYEFGGGKSRLAAYSVKASDRVFIGERGDVGGFDDCEGLSNENGLASTISAACGRAFDKDMPLMNAVARRMAAMRMASYL
jgi:hypothetical protein